MVAPFEARDIGVPETVNWPPGVKVVEPMTKPDTELAVIVELPNVTTAGGWELVGVEGGLPAAWALEFSVPGSPPATGADEEVPVPGSTATGDVDGDWFPGSAEALEVVSVGSPPPTGELVEVSVPGSPPAAGEVDVDWSTGLLDAVDAGTAGELVAVVGSNVIVVEGTIVGGVGPTEATFDEVLTA